MIAAFLCAIPPVLAFFFDPTMQSAFLVPKSSLLVASAAIVFALAVGAGIRMRPALRTLNLWMWCALLYCTATLLAWAASGRKDFGPHAVLFVLAGPALALAAFGVLGGREHWWMRALAFAGGVEAAVAFAEWQLGFDPFAPFGGHMLAQGRMVLFGTLGNPDFVAVFVAASVPAVVMLALPARDAATGQRSVWASAWWLVAALDMTAIVGSGCRTGLFAAGVGAAVAVFARFGGAQRALHGRYAAWAALVVIAVAAIVASRNPRGLWVSALGRTTIWRIALSRPPYAFGTGPGTFAYEYALRLTPFAHAHTDPETTRYIGYQRTAENDFVQTLEETGIVGLATLVATFATWFGSASRRLAAFSGVTAHAAAAAIGAVAAISAAALFESPMQRAEDWAVLWLAIALPFALRQAEEEKKDRARVFILSIRWTAALALGAAIAWYAWLPARSSWWTGEGQRMEFNNDYDDAIAVYRRAAGLDVTNADAWFNLARTLGKAGRYAEGFKASDEAKRYMHEENLWILRVRLAEGYDLPLALREAVDGLQRFPWSPDLHREMDDVLATLSNPSAKQ